MIPPPSAIVCPACGSDDLETVVGGYLCTACGHVFAMVNGKVRDMEDDDDDDEPDPAA